MTDANIIKSDFTPPWWARNRHIQTIYPRFFQRRKQLITRMERVDLPDADFVNLVWGVPEKGFKPKGLMIIFHGLEGSIHSHYTNDVMAESLAKGWQPVLMHFRSCGGVLNLTARAYHSGETEDATYVLNKLKNDFPDLPRIAIGFSLGANMLLKLFGEQANQNYVDAGIAISTPFKLDECARSINSGFSQFYQKYLLKSMRNTLIAKMRSINYDALIQLKQEQVREISSFREFDEKVTAPVHGFKDADDYYRQCSAISYLKSIQTPTYILHSKDDPFMNENVVPTVNELSSKVTLELSEKGGHVGFMTGTPWRPITWFHQRIFAYAERFVKS